MKARDSGFKGLRGFGLVRPGRGLKSEKTLGGLSASAVKSGLTAETQRRGEGLVLGLGLRLGLGGRGLIYLPIFFHSPLPTFRQAICRPIQRWMEGVFRYFYSIVGMEKVKKVVDYYVLIKSTTFPERLLVGHGQIVR